MVWPWLFDDGKFIRLILTFVGCYISKTGLDTASTWKMMS